MQGCVCDEYLACTHWDRATSEKVEILIVTEEVSFRLLYFESLTTHDEVVGEIVAFFGRVAVTK